MKREESCPQSEDETPSKRKPERPRGFLAFQGTFPELCESLPANAAAPGKPGPGPSPRLSMPSLSHPCLPVSNLGPTRVLPFLYLGSQQDAMDQETLKVYAIDYILNMSTTCPRPPFIKEEHFHRIPVNDSYTEKLLPYFEEAFEFIDKVRGANASVLVHCLAGISRSPTLAIACVMRYLRMGSEEAYRYVKEKRPSIAPNFNFLGQLLEYEKQAKAKGKENVATPTGSGPGSRISTPTSDELRMLKSNLAAHEFTMAQTLPIVDYGSGMRRSISVPMKIQKIPDKTGMRLDFGVSIDSTATPNQYGKRQLSEEPVQQNLAEPIEPEQKQMPRQLAGKGSVSAPIPESAKPFPWPAVPNIPSSSRLRPQGFSSVIPELRDEEFESPTVPGPVVATVVCRNSSAAFDGAIDQSIGESARVTFSVSPIAPDLPSPSTELAKLTFEPTIRGQLSPALQKPSYSLALPELRRCSEEACAMDVDSVSSCAALLNPFSVATGRSSSTFNAPFPSSVSTTTTSATGLSTTATCFVNPFFTKPEPEAAIVAVSSSTVVVGLQPLFTPPPSTLTKSYAAAVIGQGTTQLRPQRLRPTSVMDELGLRQSCYSNPFHHSSPSVSCASSQFMSPSKYKCDAFVPVSTGTVGKPRYSSTKFSSASTSCSPVFYENPTFPAVNTSVSRHTSVQMSSSGAKLGKTHQQCRSQSNVPLRNVSTVEPKNHDDFSPIVTKSKLAVRKLPDMVKATSSTTKIKSNISSSVQQEQSMDCGSESSSIGSGAKTPLKPSTQACLANKFKSLIKRASWPSAPQGEPSFVCSSASSSKPEVQNQAALWLAPSRLLHQPLAPSHSVNGSPIVSRVVEQQPPKSNSEGKLSSRAGLCKTVSNKSRKVLKTEKVFMSATEAMFPDSSIYRDAERDSLGSTSSLEITVN